MDISIIDIIMQCRHYAQNFRLKCVKYTHDYSKNIISRHRLPENFLLKNGFGQGKRCEVRFITNFFEFFIYAIKNDEEEHGSDEEQAEYLPDNSSSQSDDEPESVTEDEITELNSSSESDAEVITVIPNKRKTEWRKNNGKR